MVKRVGVSNKLSSIQHLKQTPQNSAFGVGKWSPKPYSMSPLVWDPKVNVAGISKYIFWNYSNLNPA